MHGSMEYALRVKLPFIQKKDPKNPYKGISEKTKENGIMETIIDQDTTQLTKECCPLFHPEKWDGKTHHWNNKKFIKASVPTLFHIPFTPMLDKKITQMMKMAEDAHRLHPEKKEILLLFTDPNPFRTELYLSVTDVVPDAQNTSLTGTFMGKVFEVDYKELPKFIKQMDNKFVESGIKVNDYYVHYAYCPKCAKEAGHNYMVLFAKLN